MAFDDLVPGGTENKIIEIMIRDSASGAGKTGLDHADVTYFFIREGDSANHVHGTCDTMALDTWASAGFIEIDSTNAPGLYQFGIPNAALAAGKNAVNIQLKGSGFIADMTKILILGSDLRAAALAANVTQWAGQSVHASSENGTPCVEVVRWDGHDVAAHGTGMEGIPKVDLAAYLSTAAHAAVTAGIIPVDVHQWLGTDAHAAGTAGIPEVNVHGVADDAITAAAIANGAIDNATFAADVGSTAYATNIIALAADKAGQNGVNVTKVAGQTASAAGAVTFPSSIGTSTLTQTQVTGGAYDITNAAVQLHSIGDHGAGLTALPAVVLANSASHGGAASVITLATPIVANATQIEGSDATDTLEAAVDAALNNAIPGSPTAGSVNDVLKDLDSTMETV